MNYCDAIALHAYPYGKYAVKYAGNAYVSSIENYTKTTDKDVWITETGQYSEPYNGTAYSLQEQADYLGTSYALLKSQHIKAYFWYELNDNNVENNLYNFNTTTFGLYDFNSNPKPALGKYFSSVSQASAPEFTSWIILTFFAVAILLSTVLIRRKIRRK
jgi:exo-beta-1,3-glucanase (GH17 family)